MRYPHNHEARTESHLSQILLPYRLVIAFDYNRCHEGSAKTPSV